MKLILSLFSRSFLCESEATAAKVFFCAKAKRQQQKCFSVRKRSDSSKMFFCSESNATVTSTFIGEEMNADLVPFQWIPKHRLIEDKASGGCHGYFERNELCVHNSKSGRNYAKAKLIA